MGRHTIRIDDDELEAVLKEADSKSEVMRKALRAYASDADEFDHDGLTEKQREAYSWLQRHVPGTMRLEPAKSELAQLLGMQAPLLKRQILVPLERQGLIEIKARLHDVVIRVNEPEEVVHASS